MNHIVHDVHLSVQQMNHIGHDVHLSVQHMNHIVHDVHMPVQHMNHIVNDVHLPVDTVHKLVCNKIVWAGPSANLAAETTRRMPGSYYHQHCEHAFGRWSVSRSV